MTEGWADTYSGSKASEAYGNSEIRTLSNRHPLRDQRVGIPHGESPLREKLVPGHGRHLEYDSEGLDTD